MAWAGAGMAGGVMRSLLSKGLIHENGRAGIMVTHDLRMCKYVDRVLQMRDGKLVRVIDDKDEIEMLARGEEAVLTN